MGVKDVPRVASVPVAAAGDCCPAQITNGAEPEARDFIALAAGFKALADPNRLKILEIVATAPHSEVCVCDLPEPLGLTQPTVSHHLKVLVEAGLLYREKRGVWAYFSPVRGALERLGAAIPGIGAAADCTVAGEGESR